MNRVAVIAEIANAHQGSPETALKMAKEFAQRGADAIKFQVYFAEEFLTENHPRYAHFKKQAFSENEWLEIFDVALGLGVEIYADVFGLKALELVKKRNLHGIKIHSSDLLNMRLLNRLALEKKKVFLGAGGTSIPELRYAISKLNHYKKPQEIVLLHGFQAYPTKIEDTCLSRLLKLKELFDDEVVYGYMDHIDAEDIYATIIPLMAIPYKVKYIEKHITLNRSSKGVDYYSSFEPDEFGSFVEAVRKAEEAVGNDPLKFPEAERHYRNTVKKTWTVTRELSKGHVLSEDDLEMKRAPLFTPPPLLDELLGKPILRGLSREASISLDVFQHKVLAVVVARSQSSRLPGKALMHVGGEPTVLHLLKRLLIAKEKGFVDTIAFCTTESRSDDRLVDVVSELPIKIYRGAVEDVLERMLLAVKDNTDHDVVLRITGDDILVDPDYLNKTVRHHLETNAHYTEAKGLPSGTEVEVFGAHTLRLIYELSKDSSGTEYLTNYISNNVDQFNVSSLSVPDKHRKSYRLTLDTHEDYQLISDVINFMCDKNKQYDYGLDDIVEFFDKYPEKVEVNKKITQRTLPSNVNTEIQWSQFTKNPLVTVYITNHNYKNYLEQSIQSVLNQKFRDFELIIIDDGSTDGSQEIISRYDNHPKVKTVYQSNKGLNITNNIALNLARGKYLIRLDADDYFDENALLVLTQKLENNKDIAMVFPDYYTVGKDGEIISHERRHNFKEVKLRDQPAHGACTMIRTEVLNSVGGYSEEFNCQDGVDIWLKITKNFSVDNVSLPLFYYRQHEQSLTKNQHRIYSTQHEIYDKYIDKSEMEKMNHIAIVPIRNNGDSVPLAIAPFAGTTLIDITIGHLIKADCIKKIIVSCSDDRVVAYLKGIYRSGEIIVDKRPVELAALNVELKETVDYVLEKYTDIIDRPESISLINYQYPLRAFKYFNKSINSLYLFNAESSISVCPRNANYYQHDGDSLISFQTNKNLRLERDRVFEEVGGIHAFKYEAYERERSVLCGTTTHILIDELAALDVNSDIRFEIAEHLYRKHGDKFR